jgi:transcriptional regulator with XRE-family HTH domain
MRIIEQGPLTEKSIVDLLDEQYLEADNKEEIGYWSALSQLVSETLIRRGLNGISQADLASRMSTTQSVISRFENLGRKPSYDFVARLSLALDGVLGMTISGDFMAVVPLTMQDVVRRMAEEKKIPTRSLVESLLEGAIRGLEVSSQFASNMNMVPKITQQAFNGATSVPPPPDQNSLVAASGNRGVLPLGVPGMSAA